MLGEIFNPLNYGFNGHGLGALVVSLMVLFLGVTLFRNNPHKLQNRVAFFMYFAVFVWLFFYAISLFAFPTQLTYFWFKYFSHSSTAFISALVYVFTLTWVDTYYEKQKRLIPLFFVFPVFDFLMNLFTSHVTSGAVEHWYGNFVTFDAWGGFFTALWAVPLLYGFYNIARIRRSSKDVLLIKNTTFFLVATLFGATGAIDYIVALYPSLEIYPFGYVSIGLMFSIMAYSIARYRFMDVESGVYRVFAWLGTSVAVGVPFGFIVVVWFRKFALVPIELKMLFVGGMLYLFSFLRGVVQPRLDVFLRRKRHELRGTLIEVNEAIFESRSVEELAHNVSKEIYALFYPRVIDYYVYKEGLCALGARLKNGTMLLLDHEKDTIAHDCGAALKDPSLREIFKKEKVIYKEILIRKTDNAAVLGFVDMLEKKHIEVVIIVTYEERIVSIIALGAKENNKFYTQGELIFLRKLQQNLGLMAQSLISFEEVLSKEKDMSLRLEKNIENRTEELVKKNKELERFNQQTIERELKMIELKKKIGELEERIAAAQ